MRLQRRSAPRSEPLHSSSNEDDPLYIFQFCDGLAKRIELCTHLCLKYSLPVCEFIDKEANTSHVKCMYM